ncbi:MAG: 50S ribosomal protein L20 [Bacillales bacterium]|nr:50S ribosomal protein L20 [Bacillales bacterium]
MRVKGGTTTRARRKKVLKRAKGYFGSKHALFKTANEQVIHSLHYAYVSRRTRKSDYRKLWIVRINAAARNYDLNYSTLMHGLKLAGVEINRKMLSEMAITDEAAFANVVDLAKKALAK